MKVLYCLLVILTPISCIDKDKTTFTEKIKCKFLENPANAPSCGVVSVGVAMKFEYLGQEYINGKYFIGIIACPELYGENFFLKDSIYTIKIIKDFNKKSELIINPYEKMKLNVFYIENISKSF